VVGGSTESSSRAVFEAELPHPGRWRLELHMPGAFEGLPRFETDWRTGTYQITVRDASGRKELTFDASAAERGWNSLGEHELARGKVRLELSSRTDGGAVIADAVRWVVPASPGLPGSRHTPDHDGTSDSKE
jgi:hypothetical protein